MAAALQTLGGASVVLATAANSAAMVRWFGTLHATLADELVSPRDRLRVLWAYRRTLRIARVRRNERFGAFVRSATAVA